MKFISILLLSFIISSCSEPPLQAPVTPAIAKSVPENWKQFQHRRSQEINKHIIGNKIAYDRFADFPVSQTNGVPYLLLKLLPIVSPEYWPDDENFLSVIGLFKDERHPAYPIARGIGFTGLSRPLDKPVVDRASFTCGGCHIGRVRKDDGEVVYLDGGINAEFNVIGFRKRMVETFDALTAGNKSKAEKDRVLVTKFLDALEWIEKKRPGYFYNNYIFEDREFDTAYEKQQIELFRQQAAEIIPAYSDRIRQVYSGWQVLVEKNYSEIKKTMMTAFPGTEDAIGFNSVDAYINFNKKPLLSLFSRLALAGEAGVSDIMAVWDQQKRNPRWNESKDDLIDGGGQWNGHIPLLIYKNIAAQLTLGVDNIDIGVSAFSEQLLEELPAPAYPFDVDITLAKKGRDLFNEHCVACHRDNNGKVYKNIGTDFGRAKIAGKLITTAAVNGFTDVCSAKTTIVMYGKQVQPCAGYRGVSLVDKEHFAMTKPDRHDGYNALPLVGIWAQAPYLHNGAIPTIYHLLMPETRPDMFIKSQLFYDQEKLGFAWQEQIKDNEGYQFDTRQGGPVSNKGHDKDIEMNGITYRLNWNGDEDSVNAIIEYMKTL